MVPSPSSAATRRIETASMPSASATAIAAAAMSSRERGARRPVGSGCALAVRVPLTFRTVYYYRTAYEYAYTVRMRTNMMTSTQDAGVLAEGLGRRFDDLWALRDVDLAVPQGSVLGLLGHNGAGKTTAVRILTTLLRPTEGRARVAGYDVVDDAATVRTKIGLAGQQATVDGLLTARANLEMVGRLYHLPRAVA